MRMPSADCGGRCCLPARDRPSTSGAKTRARRLSSQSSFPPSVFFVCYSGATMAKRRLDALLVDRGLAPDLGKAQAMVMAGAVSVDECPTQKAGTLVDEDVALRLVERARYVGRGGEKLEHALEEFGGDVLGLAVADIGASTGGVPRFFPPGGGPRGFGLYSGQGELGLPPAEGTHVLWCG